MVGEGVAVIFIKIINLCRRFFFDLFLNDRGGGAHDPPVPLDLLLISVIFLKKNYKINENLDCGCG